MNRLSEARFDQRKTRVLTQITVSKFVANSHFRMNNQRLIKGCCDVCVSVAHFCFDTFFNHFVLVSVPDRLSVVADWNSFNKPHLDFIIVVAYTPAAVEYLHGRISGLCLA